MANKKLSEKCPICGNPMIRKGFYNKSAKSATEKSLESIIKIQRYYCNQCKKYRSDASADHHSNLHISDQLKTDISSKLMQGSTIDNLAREHHLDRKTIMRAFDRYLDENIPKTATTVVQCLGIDIVTIAKQKKFALYNLNDLVITDIIDYDCETLRGRLSQRDLSSCKSAVLPLSEQIIYLVKDFSLSHSIAVGSRQFIDAVKEFCTDTTQAFNAQHHSTILPIASSLFLRDWNAVQDRGRRRLQTYFYRDDLLRWLHAWAQAAFQIPLESDAAPASAFEEWLSLMPPIGDDDRFRNLLNTYKPAITGWADCNKENGQTDDDLSSIQTLSHYDAVSAEQRLHDHLQRIVSTQHSKKYDLLRKICLLPEQQLSVYPPAETSTAANEDYLCGHQKDFCEWIHDCERYQEANKQRQKP